METASAENDEVLQGNGTACLQQPSSLLLLFQAAQRAATDSGKVSVPIQLSTGSLTQARNGWQIHRCWKQEKPWSKQLQFCEDFTSCGTLALISVKSSCPT